MPNDINNLLTSAKSSSLDQLNVKLKELRKLLILTLLGDEIKDIKDLMFLEDKSDSAEPINANILSELDNITTSKMDGEQKMYLLHRPSENFEYSESTESDSNEYETSENTTWYAQYLTGQKNQHGQNPVISCWVPESNIVGSATPHENTGAWGDLGENPFADVFSVDVKPGKYKIYQELKQKR